MNPRQVADELRKAQAGTVEEQRLALARLRLARLRMNAASSGRIVGAAHLATVAGEARQLAGQLAPGRPRR